MKIFSQILESSIAIDYEQRHIFQDLLIIADREGVVDMTHEAIARRLNVPEALIREKITQLEQPDPGSRSEEADGRRLIRLADHRDWGWQIVNYKFYRDLIDAETLRIANRERKREQRARNKMNGHAMSQNVRDSHKMSQASQNVTLSESYSDPNSKEDLFKSAEPPKKEKQSKSKPENWEEFWSFITTELGMTTDDARYLWNNWKANGFTRNGKPILDWKAAARAWKAGKFYPSQKVK